MDTRPVVPGSKPKLVPRIRERCSVSRCRWLAASLLAALVTVSLSPAAGAAFAPQKKQNPKSHAHHLLKAEEDLVAAEAAIATQNLPGAHKHVAAAMHQVEEAIAHHHKHFMSQPTGSGLGGIANRAKHHNHHATLKQA